MTITNNKFDEGVGTDKTALPIIRLFDDWQEKKFRCWFCGTDKSVKYTMRYKESGNETQTVYICSRCALPFMGQRFDCGISTNTIKKYVINYGFGVATLYSPSDDWENRFLSLAGTCFGIRKSILGVELISRREVAESDDYHNKICQDEYERLEFNGDAYIWRKDGARKMISPSIFADDEWDTSYCEECATK